MEIVLRQESPRDLFDQMQLLDEAPAPHPKGRFIPVESIKPKIAIPYKYIFALGVILVFTGIGTIALSNSKRGRVEQ